MWTDLSKNEKSLDPYPNRGAGEALPLMLCKYLATVSNCCLELEPPPPPQTPPPPVLRISPIFWVFLFCVFACLYFVYLRICVFAWHPCLPSDQSPVWRDCQVAGGEGGSLLWKERRCSIPALDKALNFIMAYSYDNAKRCKTCKV